VFRPNSLSPWKKQPARFTVPQGGSDPTNFLGG
jgi:hypothetical protein